MGDPARRVVGDSLPAETATFVGRRHELAQVRERVAESRLVTLVGPGGVGKTRLAIRAADQARRGFPDGIVFVELAEVDTPELVPHAVAQAVGLRDEGSGWTESALARRLADRRQLLVLDSCEHVVDECARLVERILSRAPDVRVLATSREALRVSGEHTFPVAPLPVPGDDAATRPLDLVQYDAVTLFVERAAARDPSFALSESNAPHVAQIVQRLDGIPLAIELAADRVRALPVAQINARLTARLQFLTTGSRSASARHRTLVASIKWSFDLCTPAQQRAWSWLSVFPSSFSVSTAEAVCASEDLPADDVLDVLAALVEKSVLTREDPEGPEARYRMLASIREFGQDRLRATGELRQAREQVVAWCSRLTTGYRESWFGPGQREWLRRLRAEHQNVATALRLAVEKDDPAAAMTMASDLYSHWSAVGMMSEGRHWLQRGLAKAAPGTPGRAAALRWLAYFNFYLGDRDEVEPLLAAARAELDDQSPATERAHLLLVEGLTRMAEVDVHAAKPPLAAALRLFETCDDHAGRAHALLSLGFVQWLCGDLASAQASFEECLVLTEAFGERTFHSSALLHLGMVLGDAGEPERARPVLLDVLRLKVQDEEDVSQAVCLEALSRLSADDDPRRAAVLAGCAAAAWRRSGAAVDSIDAMRRLRALSYEKLRESLGSSALEHARSVGAKMGAGQALAYADGATAPARTDRERAQAIEPLTMREWQVARQVAHGLGNRQIAGRLAISPRTVDAHVAHILQKLAFGSRAQVAAWVTERRHQVDE